jgi:4-amino-4-deoxy-L-arabinose transferase-like glycosyltransferase
LHVLLCVAVYAFGRAAVSPSTFDGDGVAVSFASDGVRYRADADAMSGSLRRGEFCAWASADKPFHVKLYAVSFALFGPLLGYGVLGAEPLNLWLYLACVALVFRIGREVFGRRAGLLAACAVALWPSFLLHTTQFLKDPLFVALTLALVLVNTRWLTRECTWAGALLAGAAGGLAVTTLWLARSGAGEVLFALALLGALALVARQARERRLLAANVAGAALVLALTLGVPRLMPGALELGRSPSSARWAGRATREEETGEGFLSNAAARVGRVRRMFVEMYPDSGSNVDAGVRIESTPEFLRYLPRAAEVGFFAPFPVMWFSAGKSVGTAGRLLGGVETLLLYAVEALALITLWRARMRPEAWLLFASAAAGVVALGLVAVNVGTLFRLRYVFVMLLIILAAEASARFVVRRSGGTRPRAEAGA